MAKQSHLQQLVQQGVRYLVAARQDAHPVIAALHYNYAVAWLEAARVVTSDRGLIAEIDDTLATAKAEQDDTQRELLRRIPPVGTVPAIVFRT
jgi:hypothetical protein